MAMLDMLLPGGVSGAPDEPFYDPLSGMPIRGPSRRPGQIRQWPEPPPPPPSPPPDPNAWNPGATPVPYQGMLSNDVNAALPKPAPPLPPPTSIGPPPGMLSGSALPPAATPASSPAPSAPSPPAAAAPLAAAASSSNVPETSILGRIGDALKAHSNTFLALGAGMAGAPSFGQGLSRGFAAAIPAGQADLRLQQQNASLPIIRDRLMKQGMSDSEASNIAMAAIGNPAIMQQLIPGLFGPKQTKFSVIREDATGKKEYGWVDEVNRKAYDLSGKEVALGAGAQSAEGLHGDAFLKTQDPGLRDDIKAMAEGRLPSAGFGAQKNLLPLVAQYDPNFDATQYPVMLKTRQSYTSGKDFQETQALNTVSGHMGRLMESADGLNNSNFKPINYARNWWSDTVSDNPALVRFRNDLVTTSNELAKAYHGGHVSDAAYNAFNKTINEAQTPDALKSAIGEMAGLLQSKIEAKESGYRSSMGNAPLPAEFKAINDEAKHSFQRIGDWAHGLKAEKPAASAAAPAQAASAIPPPAQREVGKTYQTPKGPAIWMGNGWQVQ